MSVRYRAYKTKGDTYAIFVESTSPNLFGNESTTTTNHIGSLSLENTALLMQDLRLILNDAKQIVRDADPEDAS